MIWTLVGVDPGLVNTGVVELQFDDLLKTVRRREFVYVGFVPSAIKDGLRHVLKVRDSNATIIVEDYRVRDTRQTNTDMLANMGVLKSMMTDATYLDNMGVKKVITAPIAKAFHAWDFTQQTHHDDLRSAARIALFGAAKLDHWNALMYTYLKDYEAGKPWPLV